MDQTLKLPWQPITLNDVEQNIEILKEADPKFAALSAHDSSPETITVFQESFKDSYRHIIVGRSLEI